MSCSSRSQSERERSGLLKAVGVTRTQVVAVFLVEAAILATVGGCLGLLGGFGSGQFLQQLYPDFPYETPVLGRARCVGRVLLGRD